MVATKVRGSACGSLSCSTSCSGKASLRVAPASAWARRSIISCTKSSTFGTHDPLSGTNPSCATRRCSRSAAALSSWISASHDSSAVSLLLAKSSRPNPCGSRVYLTIIHGLCNATEPEINLMAMALPVNIQDVGVIKDAPVHIASSVGFRKIDMELVGSVAASLCG